MIPLALSCDVGLLSSSVMSVFPSISDPPLSLVLPSEPVDVVDAVESLPDTFGFASADELLHRMQQLPTVSDSVGHSRLTHSTTDFTHYHMAPFLLTGSHSFWMKKNPGVFQSNFKILQVRSVIIRNRISNIFGQQ